MTPTRTFAAAWAMTFAVVALPTAAYAQSNSQQQQTPAKPKTTAKTAAPAKPAAATKPAASTNASAAKPAAPAAKPAATQASTKPVASDEPKLLGQYGEWGAYMAAPSGKKLCFALAKPGSSQTEPANRPRDPAYLFISTRPGDKVKDEVSLIIGYPLKANTEVTAAVGGTNFALYTQEDGAWIKNASDEPKMVEAMRKGSDLVVKGESGRGTKTTDTFSLKGISQALDRVSQECK